MMVADTNVVHFLHVCSKLWKIMQEHKEHGIPDVKNMPAEDTVKKLATFSTKMRKKREKAGEFEGKDTRELLIDAWTETAALILAPVLQRYEETAQTH